MKKQTSFLKLKVKYENLFVFLHVFFATLEVKLAN